MRAFYFWFSTRTKVKENVQFKSYLQILDSAKFLSCWYFWHSPVHHWIRVYLWRGKELKFWQRERENLHHFHRLSLGKTDRKRHFVVHHLPSGFPPTMLVQPTWHMYHPRSFSWTLFMCRYLASKLDLDVNLSTLSHHTRYIYRIWKNPLHLNSYHLFSPGLEREILGFLVITLLWIVKMVCVSTRTQATWTKKLYQDQWSGTKIKDQVLRPRIRY